MLSRIQGRCVATRIMSTERIERATFRLVTMLQLSALPRACKFQVDFINVYIFSELFVGYF
jgi:hypothetical protein